MTSIDGIRIYLYETIIRVYNIEYLLFNNKW